MTQVLFMIIFLLKSVHTLTCKSILVREYDKPWFDEIHGKEIGKTEGS